MAKLVKDPDRIKLGIIGMTEGNGHPYSWSAIFNGYDRRAMTKECPFPGIPLYLNKEAETTLAISGAKVTHIYCDKRKDAGHVAKCSLIPQVVDVPEAMIGQVDAVIIATDIGSQHVDRARPFVKAGVPLFIDKPLCDNAADLAVFRRWIEAEKCPVLSSSCMRYKKELLPYRLSTSELGELRLITMPMAKKWETYGIHALEAIYPIVGPGFVSVQNTGTKDCNLVHMTHKNNIDIIIGCINGMAYGGPICLNGTCGAVAVNGAGDSFYAFKAQLQAFVDYLRSGVLPFPFAETEELMKLVIGGIRSREENNRKILLSEIV
ncbi:MAG: Gfo/Idh/MocA family oxidoreductase [Victivallales bacterium]|nr:Gfo/Idh/MocA family oxidoreductase [Victivallales bacterium]